MGNWRPVVEVNSSLSSSSGSATGPANSPPPAIHFWQGAEEIRLYGPMQKNNSKATEPGPWSCSQEFRMVGVNPQSIELEQGRWFFSQSACQASTTEKDTMRGCIADLARGKIRDQTSAVIP